MADRLITVFSQVLGEPETALGDETSPDTCAKWTSLAAMQLVAALEEEFQIRLTTREIIRMRTIGICREVLRGKGISDV